jgi:hypothetical protein
MRRLVVAALAAALLISACGGGDEVSSPASTEAPEASTTILIDEEEPNVSTTLPPVDPEETFILAIRVLPDFDLDGNGDEAKKAQWIADARQVCLSIQESGSDEAATADMADKYGIFEGPFFVGVAQSTFCPETS